MRLKSKLLAFILSASMMITSISVPAFAQTAEGAADEGYENGAIETLDEATPLDGEEAIPLDSEGEESAKLVFVNMDQIDVSIPEGVTSVELNRNRGEYTESDKAYTAYVPDASKEVVLKVDSKDPAFRVSGIKVDGELHTIIEEDNGTVAFHLPESSAGKEIEIYANLVKRQVHVTFTSKAKAYYDAAHKWKIPYDAVDGSYYLYDFYMDYSEKGNTIYLDPELHHILKLIEETSGISLSPSGVLSISKEVGDSTGFFTL